MKIRTRVVGFWDGSRYVASEITELDYAGSVALCKGDATAKAAEEQQLQFNTQLMSIFQQQFAKQSQIFDFLKGKLQPMIDNPTGYSPEALAAMRTSATDTLSQNYQNAQRALQSEQFARGGRDLPSGVNAQLDAALQYAEASDKAGAQNTITLQNENLKQSNFWNAMNALNGQEAIANPLGYAGAATSGSNAVANLSQAYTASQQSGLMGMLGGLAGGALSGAGSAGGFGKLFGCWLAAAHFGGWHDPRTHVVRQWLWTRFCEHWYGRALMALYMRFGERLSRSRLAVMALGPLFDAALLEACNG